ncbi:MAG: hypothetical protein HC816_21785 [Leptolyngbyaceae cyanobacterium RM1_1_2]|nr:hypothetical protein [Leptolyngbyaceae cyanobacterium RM1_1_2]
MALTISPRSLLSRITRESVSGKKPKLIQIGNVLTQKDSKGNILQRVWGGLSRVFGFITKLTRFALRVTDIFGWIINGIGAISRFNWNQTDLQLQQTLKNQNLLIASTWGSFAGQGAGWLAGLAIGYGVSLVVPVIGSAALARGIAATVGSEALEELYFGLMASIRATATGLATGALINAYVQARRFLKRAPIQALTKLFGAEKARFIKNKWGAEGGPDLSFATQFEESIENLGDDYVQVFLENFFEESWDGFIESGYIVASELDAAYAQASAAQGPERRITLIPDQRAPAEAIFLSGPEAQVRVQAQTALTQHRLIYNRDVGAIVGQPAEDWYRARPQRRKLTLIFNERPEPPWRLAGGRRPKTATYAIPDVKAGLTWEELKRFARPYTWGGFRATANLNNGRQMAVYASTPTEAEKMLRRLAQLSTAEITTVSTTAEGQRNPNLKKKPTYLYPAFAYLLVRRPSIDASGRTDLEGGTWDESKQRIDLWPPQQPPDFLPLK